MWFLLYQFISYHIYFTYHSSYYLFFDENVKKREFHAILLPFHLFSTLRKVVNCVRFCMNHLWHGVSIGQFTDRQANIDTYYMHESLLLLKLNRLSILNRFPKTKKAK